MSTTNTTKTSVPFWTAMSIPKLIEDVRSLVQSLAPSYFSVEETLKDMEAAKPGDVFFIPNIGHLVLVNSLPEKGNGRTETEKGCPDCGAGMNYVAGKVVHGRDCEKD